MQNLFRDRLIVIPFGVAIAILIISIFIGFNISDDSGKLILNYDLENNPILGDKLAVLSIVALFGVAIALNYFLAFILYNREKFMSYLLSIATPVIGVLILIFFYAIHSLN